jgi:hypothetical protein
VVITVSITSKTQINKKELNVKILGYLPRVLFFNAFKLDAENANQVISSDEVLGSAGALRLPFLPLLLTLGKTWLLQGGEINLILPFPTSITAPMSFSRDLPSVICPFPTHSITR